VVEGEFDLPVLARLDEDDRAFALRFLESSGSLKAMARLYGVSYPTVRNRLDALIDRLHHLQATHADESGEDADGS
jgi:hypothetical protein